MRIIGHRGARGLFPENTLAGFTGAVALGVDAIELDVAVTADGVAVISHDPALSPNLTRGPDGAWLSAPGPLIRSLPAAALAAYDVGRVRPRSCAAAAFPAQIPCDGARIPTLAEALRVAGDRPVLIELKSFPTTPKLAMPKGVPKGVPERAMQRAPARAAPERAMDGAAMAEIVLGVVQAAGCAARVTVESFDWRGPRRLRRRHAGVGLALLTNRRCERAARLWWDGPHPADFGGSVPRAVAAEGVAGWGPDHRTLTEARLAEAHALGLVVIPWTVNQPADMRRLAGWGVDGLVTDRPDLARLVLAAAGLLPPAQGG